MYRSTARRVMTALAIVTVLLGAAAQPASAARPRPNVYYEYMVRHTGLCLDVREINPLPGAVVQQWPCWNGPGQRWKITYVITIDYVTYANISVEHSGLCLDAPEPVRGSVVQQAVCSPFRASQQWFFPDVGSGFYAVCNRAHLCLDVRDVSPHWGAVVQLWDYWGGHNQQWTFYSV